MCYCFSFFIIAFVFIVFVSLIKVNVLLMNNGIVHRIIHFVPQQTQWNMKNLKFIFLYRKDCHLTFKMHIFVPKVYLDSNRSLSFRNIKLLNPCALYSSEVILLKENLKTSCQQVWLWFVLLLYGWQHIAAFWILLDFY